MTLINVKNIRPNHTVVPLQGPNQPLMSRACARQKRSRQANANKPNNYQSVTSDTSSVSDDEAHKNKTRKAKKPRSSIIRQLTRNLTYDGKGS